MPDEEEKQDYPEPEDDSELITKDDDSPGKQKEDTRRKIAVFYVWGFFGTIAVVFGIGIYKCFNVDDYVDMLIAVSAILSGPLGFIIGFYFKSDSKE